MCGIFCSLMGCGSCHESTLDTLDACSANLKCRGPDLFQSLQCDAPSGHRLTFAASVLQTQGEQLCRQPCSANGNILCWNGDVFGGKLANEIRNSGLCDTEVVFRHLCECMQQGLPPWEVFNQIEGPYSFIFYHKDTHTVWFGRDPAGRHSLLYEFTEHPLQLTLTSVGHSSLCKLQEVPAVGLFEARLSVALNQTELLINLHPWWEMEAEKLYKHCEGLSKIQLKSSICHQYIFRPSSFKRFKPNKEELQLFKHLAPAVSDKIKALSNVESFKSNVARVLSLLEAAVKVRVQTNVKLCQNCLISCTGEETFCCHSKVAVLFSGGLDSAILAKLVDKFVPENEPIDLLNVAFEKKTCTNKGTKSHKNNQSENLTCSIERLTTTDDLYDVPDRLSGRKTLHELQNLCPGRKWNFVEINVPAAELQEKRWKCIGHLIHPLKTVLDDSLGCALWFAARGQGTPWGSSESYTSPARIVITGMGADEQFGGYMRHRTILKNQGWEALYSQLQMELERIPSRNLGRDDRVVSHHGKQPRMPFLDENVISFVKSLPPWERCCPNDELPCGIGDKLLLRLVAWKIGLQGAAVLPKRAMQFGSRIANSKENAADTSNRL